MSDKETLVSVAIIRDGTTHSRGLKSHGQLRSALGDEDPYTTRHRPKDTEGFITSNGRFVSREDALYVALEAKQVRAGFNRRLLSSDVWW